MSNTYAEFEEAPSFLPPNISISEFDIAHAPNQYLISFSKLYEYTLISSQYKEFELNVSNLSISVMGGSYPPITYMYLSLTVTAVDRYLFLFNSGYSFHSFDAIE